MPGIKVILALVRCSQSLLLCEDIDTHRLRFSDIEDCMRRLPSIVRGEQAKQDAQGSVIILGRCRFQLDREAPEQARAIAETPGH
jgi:hypothetical protein